MNVVFKRAGLAALAIVLAACGSAAPAAPDMTATTSPEEMATAFYQTLQAPTPTLAATPVPPTAVGATETLAASPTLGADVTAGPPAGTARPGATLRGYGHADAPRHPQRAGQAADRRRRLQPASGVRRGCEHSG